MTLCTATDIYYLTKGHVWPEGKQCRDRQHKYQDITLIDLAQNTHNFLGFTENYKFQPINMLQLKVDTDFCKQFTLKWNYDCHRQDHKEIRNVG